jgi:hypothetical protein
MEHLWSQAGATGGNWSQMRPPHKRLKQADRQPMATHGNRFGAHGKEGVDGSSPSEGFAKSPVKPGFSCRLHLHNPQRAVGMEPFIEPSDRKLGPEVCVASGSGCYDLNPYRRNGWLRHYRVLAD